MSLKDMKVGEAVSALLFCGFIGLAVGLISLLGPVAAGLTGAGMAAFIWWVMSSLSSGWR